MDISGPGAVDRRQHLFARCMVGVDDTRLDIGAFAERLLAFEKYTLQSRRCQEVRDIVMLIGVQETERLLESGELVIHDRVESVGSFPRNFYKRKCAVPPLHYTFQVVQEGAPNEPNELAFLVRKHLAKVEFPGIEYRSVRRLKSLLQKKVITQSGFDKVTAGFLHDLRERPDILKFALREQLRRHGFAAPTEFDAYVSGSNTFDDALRVHTSLPAQLRVSPETLHEPIDAALHAVSRINEELALMNGVRATRELPKEDLDFFQRKIADVARIQGAAVTEQLGRVLSVAGLPDLSQAAATGRVDFKRLIALRGTDEAKEFRMWLLQADTASDQELARIIGGLRKRMAASMQSWHVKVLQILVLGAVATPLSAAAGYATGVALGLLDAFVLQKLLASTGPALFVNGKVRSLFDPE